MYIVVSTDKRIPVDLDTGFQVEKWTPEEFFTKASEGDGLVIDEGLWYDVSDLQSVVYEALAGYSDAGIDLVYYRFEDRPMPSFPIDADIKVYSTSTPNTEEVTPELNTTTPSVETPVMANEPQVPIQPTVAQMPVEDTPIVSPQVEYQAPVQPTVAEPNYSQMPEVNPQPVQTPSVTPTPNVNTETQLNREMMENNLGNMLQYDDFDAINANRRNREPGKVILFGSSKGGSGKTFTCLMTAYWYAKKHPTQKIALADFDIIDGQIGITINKLTPTMKDYYTRYYNDQKDFINLDNCKVKSSYFNPNIDFYLAPSQDIPQITNDNAFWYDVFNHLIRNYDVVFFDSGIDYIGKPPISHLYKIADHIFITCNPSINSVKSVIKQLKTLSGKRQNNIFRQEDNILEKINVILTRVDFDDADINSIVDQNLTTFVPIIAKFGQIDKTIKEVQWYQRWNKIDSSPEIIEQLEKIIAF